MWLNWAGLPPVGPPEPELVATITIPWLDDGGKVPIQSYSTDDQRITMSDKISDLSVNAIAYSEGSPFTRLHPAQTDRLPAVKLTTDNVRGIAAHIIKAAGGLVEVLREPLAGLDTGVRVGTTSSGSTFKLGTWLVEDWDYEKSEILFRAATLEERIKYNLR